MGFLSDLFGGTAAKAAQGASKAQQEAVLSERWTGGHYTSYRLRIGMNTLTALHTRGLVGRHAGIGSMFSPQTNIRWPLTPLGLAVRAELERSNEG